MGCLHHEAKRETPYSCAYVYGTVAYFGYFFITEAVGGSRHGRTRPCPHWPKI